MELPLDPLNLPAWLERFHRLRELAGEAQQVVREYNQVQAEDLAGRRMRTAYPALQHWIADVRAAELPDGHLAICEKELGVLGSNAMGEQPIHIFKPVERIERAAKAILSAAATSIQPRQNDVFKLAIISTVYRFDQKSPEGSGVLSSGAEFGIEDSRLARIARLAVKEELLGCTTSGLYRITDEGRQWFEEQIRRACETANNNAASPATPAANGFLSVADVSKHLSFMASDQLRTLAIDLIGEINRTRQAGASLATMVLCGSAVETMMFDIAEQIPAKLNFAGKANWADSMSLPKIVEELRSVGLLTETVRPIAVADHRDLVHPNRRRKSSIRVDSKAARAMMLLVEIVAHDLWEAHSDGRLAALK